MSTQLLNAQQQKLIQVLLLRNKVISEAAAQVGISAELARSWMQKPFMRAAFERARQETVSRLIEEARAGKVDEALQQAASISPDLTARVKVNLSSLDAEDQAKAQERIQQFIGELQAFLRLPISKLIVWR
jgi:hypothetical protein